MNNTNRNNRKTRGQQGGSAGARRGGRGGGSIDPGRGKLGEHQDGGKLFTPRLLEECFVSGGRSFLQLS